MAIKVVRRVEDPDQESGEGFTIEVQVVSGKDLLCGPDYSVVWCGEGDRKPVFLTRADAFELGQALSDAANTYDTDDDVDA